ncbi:PBS1-like 19 [Hibiscus trionum]|uniref:PBS1-like 19 n=1 Tax=Hibiscus trionum TaxID=183268 RepID=A0A9W7MC26_HIBTR|nr:PBS1-like 19 [Hibiscus trionum]
MKCFQYLKDKLRSAPESKGERSAAEGYSGPDRTIESSFLAAPPRSLSELEAKAHNLRVFSFSELKQATRNFNPGLKIGEGGFGIVYKGTIKPADGQGKPLVVAIKMLKWESSQGQKEWLAEIHFLSVLEHPNVIKLIGHCAVVGEEGNHRLLVYEFMRKGSLANHLFNQASPPLPWNTRLQIMHGAAQGLAYLHEGFQVQIIHRSFRTSDVLLDEKFNPKLSDFGFAREGPTAGDTHVTTRVMGTYGYAAPEYIATGRLTYKCDVWSFGVVLYEILSGRRSIDVNCPISDRSLVEWVKRFPANRKSFRFLMDHQLGNQYSIGAAREIAKLADACLSTSPQERPKMSEVVERLKHIIQVSEEGSAKKMKNRPETKKKSNNQMKSQMTHIAEESKKDASNPSVIIYIISFDMLLPC